MSKPLKQLCEEIEAGYAAEKSGMDDDMLPLLQDLADRTGEIKRLTELADKLSEVDGQVTLVQGVVWFEDGTTVELP